MAFAVVDDMGRHVVLASPPQRIVSLVPSDTDTLFRLGAGDRLVGRTSYCVEPAGRVESIPEVGGTKDVDVDAVCALGPTLVVANQEENARGPLEELARRGVPLFVSFPRRVADGIAHAARLARMLGLAQAPEAAELLRRGYELSRAPAPAAAARVRVFVPIWRDPWMTFSADTVADDALRWAGADNVFADRERKYPLAADLGRRSPLAADRVAHRDKRYPRITAAEIEERAPELVLLPDEPYAFSEADADFFRGLDIPAARREGGVRRVDGKDLFWYGARSVEALPRLRALVEGAA